MWSSWCSSSANGARMPRPSTKPSSSTYISTPKPITPNHTTGSQYSITRRLLRVRRHRQRPRRRLVAVVGVRGGLVRFAGPCAPGGTGTRCPRRTRSRTRPRRRSARSITLPAASIGRHRVGRAQQRRTRPTAGARSRRRTSRRASRRSPTAASRASRAAPARLEQAPAPPLPQRGQRQQQHQRADADHHAECVEHRLHRRPILARHRLQRLDLAVQRVREDQAAQLRDRDLVVVAFGLLVRAPRTAPAARLARHATPSALPSPRASPAGARATFSPCRSPTRICTGTAIAANATASLQHPPGLLRRARRAAGTTRDDAADHEARGDERRQHHVRAGDTGTTG